MLSVALTALLATWPVLPDHLEPVDGKFADFSSDTLQAKFHRLLLKHPRRVLHMVTVPSFDLEHAVYVTNDAQGGSTVVYAAFIGSTRRGDPKRLLPDGGGWSAADVWSAEAPISPALVKKLQQLWSLAILGTHAPAKPLIMKDGVHHFFAVDQSTGERVGRTTDQLDEKTKMAALIRIGQRLGYLARAAEEDRAALELELEEAVQTLKVRFMAEQARGLKGGSSDGG